MKPTLPTDGPLSNTKRDIRLSSRSTMPAKANTPRKKVKVIPLSISLRVSDGQALGTSFINNLRANPANPIIAYAKANNVAIAMPACRSKIATPPEINKGMPNFPQLECATSFNFLAQASSSAYFFSSKQFQHRNHSYNTQSLLAKPDLECPIWARSLSLPACIL